MTQNNGELVEIIRAAIAREGPIPFERFMAMALYYPGLGYYASPGTEIGRRGDFYTSPHLHPLFGAVFGRQVEECWKHLGRPDRFRVVEQGAGQGYLAADLLDSLQGSDLYDAVQYVIVERNPAVRDAQQDVLKSHLERVAWIERPGEPGPAEGCFLSNELLDAFPVHLVEMQDELKEVYVGTKGTDFIEVLDRPSTPGIERYCSEFSLDLQKGHRTEINLRIRDWIGETAECMSGGFVITIDYGYAAAEYYAAERTRGTLLCYYRHQANEHPFQHVGRQDMTAHVNFSAVKKWGEARGLRTLGYCGQGTYLVSMGIDEMITAAYHPERDTPGEDYEFELAKIKRLILPGGMGESHNVMIQYKGDGEPKMRGFTLRNRMHRL